LRETLARHRTLARKLSELERRFEKHDEEIQSLFHAIRQLMTAPEPKRRKIGFILKNALQNTAGRGQFRDVSALIIGGKKALKIVHTVVSDATNQIGLTIPPNVLVRADRVIR